jgi:hypothetical protein
MAKTNKTNKIQQLEFEKWYVIKQSLIGKYKNEIRDSVITQFTGNDSVCGRNFREDIEADLKEETMAKYIILGVSKKKDKGFGKALMYASLREHKDTNLIKGGYNFENKRLQDPHVQNKMLELHLFCSRQKGKHQGEVLFNKIENVILEKSDLKKYTHLILEDVTVKMPNRTNYWEKKGFTGPLRIEAKDEAELKKVRNLKMFVKEIDRSKSSNLKAKEKKKGVSKPKEKRELTKSMALQMLEGHINRKTANSYMFSNEAKNPELLLPLLRKMVKNVKLTLSKKITPERERFDLSTYVFSTKKRNDHVESFSKYVRNGPHAWANDFLNKHDKSDLIVKKDMNKIHPQKIIHEHFKKIVFDNLDKELTKQLSFKSRMELHKLAKECMISCIVTGNKTMLTEEINNAKIKQQQTQIKYLETLKSMLDKKDVLSQLKFHYGRLNKLRNQYEELLKKSFKVKQRIVKRLIKKNHFIDEDIINLYMYSTDDHVLERVYDKDTSNSLTKFRKSKSDTEFKHYVPEHISKQKELNLIKKEGISMKKRLNEIIKQNGYCEKTNERCRFTVHKDNQSPDCEMKNGGCRIKTKKKERKERKSSTDEKKSTPKKKRKSSTDEKKSTPKKKRKDSTKSSGKKTKSPRTSGKKKPRTSEKKKPKTPEKKKRRVIPKKKGKK